MRTAATLALTLALTGCAEMPSFTTLDQVQTLANLLQGQTGAKPATVSDRLQALCNAPWSDVLAEMSADEQAAMLPRCKP